MDITPKVSFVTVNYRMPHFIRNLFEGIEQAAWTFPFEYFLVDNDSKDGIPALVRERFPWVSVREQENKGFGSGNNLAFQEAKGEYVILLNPDLTIFPGEVERWIEWMDAHPEIAISGPRTLNPDRSDQLSCYAFPSLFTPVYRRTFLGALPWAKRELRRFLMQDIDRTKEQDVDWIQGSAMCIRRSLLEQIGGFDERFFMYFEDTDLCRRAWAAGARVTYTPSATLVHYHRRQSRVRHPWEILRNKMTRVHIQSALRYFWKYRGTPHPRATT
ncbi:glycosyltransferase family 2 protein [Patescibacteria group bacterium]|nr:glycosyltransferase family 2 protein [Patescibacteria group bacterium]